MNKKSKLLEIGLQMEQTNFKAKMLVAVVVAFASLQANAAVKMLDLSKGESRIEFLAVGKPSMLKIRGKGGPLTGKVSVKDLIVSGIIDVDLNSFDTGINLRNTHMKEKYLQTGQYPKAQLTMGKIALPADWLTRGKLDSVPFDGILKLRGVEKPVSGTLSLANINKTVDGNAKFKFKITDFGIEVPSYAGIKVTDEVEVDTYFKSPLEDAP